MRIEEKKQGNVAIICINGNLKGTCEADVLHQEVLALLNNHTNKIVLDMHDVHWMGSLCIGAIMREIISARQMQGDVHLAALSKKVKRLFKITKLEGVVHIYTTVDEAISGFERH
jgi:anti-anti-sigma factor